jgi:AcrR family transcriptional regulator
MRAMPAPSKKEAIRREALRMFVERGIAAVSVRDIAQAVGMSPPNLYAHFTGKDELVADLFREGYATYGAAIAEAAAVPGGFARRLEAMVRRICRLHDEDETLFQFLLLTQHGHLAAVAADGNNPIEVLHRAVKAATAAREIPPVDPALVTAAVVGIIVQAATFRLYGRISRPMGEMADEIVALCFRLVAP